MLNCLICEKALTGKQSRFCSNNCKNKYHQTYPSQQLRGLRRKVELVMLLGGKCTQCGYDKNLAALSFHHKDKSQKSHKLDARSLSNRTLSVVMKEFAKCELLCMNCHLELHNPHLEFEALREDERLEDVLWKEKQVGGFEPLSVTLEG